MEGWKKRFELKICFKQDLSCVCVCELYIQVDWICLRLFEISVGYDLERFLLEHKLLWSLVFSFGLQSVHKTRFGNRCNRIEWVGPDSIKLSTNGTHSVHWLMPTIRVVVPWFSSYQSTSNSKFNVYSYTPYTIIYKHIVILYNFQRNHALQERPWPATSPLWQKKCHYLISTVSTTALCTTTTGCQVANIISSMSSFF